MPLPHAPPLEGWALARLAAALIAVDPGLGGALVTARAGPVREAFLDTVRALINEDAPWRRIPAGISDEALLGGMDLAATLKTGRPVMREGLLGEIRGGAGVLAMAERAGPGLAARLAMALDGPDAPVILALDESADPDEGAPRALAERLALHINLSQVALGDLDAAGEGVDRETAAMARMHLPHVLSGEAARALTETAAALGIDSLRPPLMALRAARAAAALEGLDEVTDAQTVLAARLVLAPRATQLPRAEGDENDAPPDDPANDRETRNEDPPASDDETPSPDALTEITLEAARAAIPADLLARLEAGVPNARSRAAGKAGAAKRGGLRGRPAGSRRGDPGEGRRLDVLATLRAAAPWGRMRRKGWKRLAPGPAVEVRREDFRIKHFKEKAETLTLFVVDASGSLALNRLADAKGAVEMMLAQSYVRRDQVALIAFRGRGAETLLPPTRSLTRAKRCLAALPGGGGTPLAAAIEAAEALAHGAARQGRTVTLVFLTDGAANVTRDGHGGREAAMAEASEAARRLRAAGHGAIIVDVSKRGAETARVIAQDMAARYVRLPAGDCGALAQLARKAAA
ncbi:magnesium chelatase subunit D [Alkalicaulis satelles]|uniref:Magnesium chelatase subunit D n=1 Tax=Alkalicaulis satelles TaxID=2609175 RepID=A0A5M6ZPI0_9PROT|nr:magnesium chelatase subunit D [Alkalicaulis satelles]